MILLIVNFLEAFVIISQITKIFPVSATLAILTVLFAYSFRVYDLENIESFNEQFVRVAVSSLINLILVGLVISWISATIRFLDVVNSFMCLILVLPISNFLYGKVLKNIFTKPRIFLVIGRKDEIGHLLDEIYEKSRGKYVFKDYVNPSTTVLKKKIRNFENILVADFQLYETVQSIIDEYSNCLKIYYLPELVERVLKRIPLEVIDKFRVYYEIAFENANPSPLKRVIDIFGALAGIILYSPIVAVFSLLILLEDGFPIVFKQLRIGKDGREFVLVKLRSMKKVNTGMPKFADQEQSRILKVGKVMRQLRIDESLQFWNVLKGDMSLVGPRPEQVPFAREFEKIVPYYHYRHKIKPGLTGWAQIMYQYSSSLDEVKKKLEYDLYYVKNNSLFMDLRIILQTFEAIFWRRGAK